MSIAKQTLKASLVLAATLWAGMSTAGGTGPEPLTLRVQDATAPPGGLVAVVLRTYATRPIRQGQVCMVFLRQRQTGTKSATRIPATGPFATMENAIVFSDAGDTIEQAQFMPTEPGQPTLLGFASPSGTVNASDGPMLVLYYRLRPDVLPGETYELSIDLANTAIIDADGQPVLLEVRGGELAIRAETDPIAVSAAAEAPDAFNTVMLSMQTEEPIAIASGQVGFRYSRDLLPATPKIQVDPRYGNAQLTHVQVRGLIVVQFSSPDLSLNTVPGDIISLYAKLNTNADPGTDRSIWLDPVYTFLYDSNGSALPLIFDDDVIP